MQRPPYGWAANDKRPSTPFSAHIFRTRPGRIPASENNVLVFRERGAQNRGKECHLIDAGRQLSDKLFQTVVQ